MKERRLDPCGIDGCGRKLYDMRRGLCAKHYNALHARGELPPLPTLTDLLVDAHWRRITEEGCWEWRGAIAPTGYGTWGESYIHRVSWEHFRGAIADGLTIDHLCRNTRCFNPDHLEPVTAAVNIRRAGAARAGTHCRRGHSYDDAYQYVTASGKVRRYCRPCAIERSRARYRTGAA